MKRYLKKQRYFLVIIAALSTFVAMITALLPRSSLWYDESYTATLVAHSPADIVSLARVDVHPPFYYLVLKAWASVFGYHTVALRAFSAVCMFLAVVVLVRFLYHHVSKRSAAYSAVILTAAPYILRYSTEMRMYAFGTLLSVLLTVVFYHLVVSNIYPRTGWWYGVYALLGAALIYTQYFFGLLLLGQLVYLTLYHSGKGHIGHRLRAFCRCYNGLLMAYLGVAVLFSPWASTFIRQVRGVQNGFWISPVSAVSPLDSATHLLALSPFDKIQGYMAVLFWLGLLAILFAIKRASMALNTSERAIVRLGWVGVVTTAFLLFVISLPPNQSLYHNRYLMTASAFLYVAIAVSLSKLPIRRYYIIYLLIGSLLLSGVGRAFREGNNFDRSHGYFSGNLIAERLSYEFQPGDIVLSTSLWTYMDAYQYFKVEHSEAGIDSILLYQPSDYYQKQGPESVVYDRQSSMIRPAQLCDLHPTSGRLWLIDEPKPQITHVPNKWLISSTVLESQGYARLLLVRLPIGSSKSCSMVSNYL